MIEINDNLPGSLTQNLERQIIGSAFFVQGMCFAGYTYNSDYTYLIHIVFITYVNKLKVIIQSFLSLLQLNVI